MAFLRDSQGSSLEASFYHRSFRIKAQFFSIFLEKQSLVSNVSDRNKIQPARTHTRPGFLQLEKSTKRTRPGLPVSSSLSAMMVLPNFSDLVSLLKKSNCSRHGQPHPLRSRPRSICEEDSDRSPQAVGRNPQHNLLGPPLCWPSSVPKSFPGPAR